MLFLRPRQSNPRCGAHFKKRITAPFLLSSRRLDLCKCTDWLLRISNEVHRRAESVDSGGVKLFNVLITACAREFSLMKILHQRCQIPLSVRGSERKGDLSRGGALASTPRHPSRPTCVRKLQKVSALLHKHLHKKQTAAGAGGDGEKS